MERAKRWSRLEYTLLSAALGVVNWFVAGLPAGVGTFVINWIVFELRYKGLFYPPVLAVVFGAVLGGRFYYPNPNGMFFGAAIGVAALIAYRVTLERFITEHMSQ